MKILLANFSSLHAMVAVSITLGFAAFIMALWIWKSDLKTSKKKDRLLNDAAHALEMYLQAGSKEARRNASTVAKSVYHEITGKPYRNNNP